MKLFESSTIDSNTWIEKVTSKGGTTHAALESFRSNTIDDHIKKGRIINSILLIKLKDYKINYTFFVMCEFIISYIHSIYNY